MQNIQDLIQAMGAASMNTNMQMGHMAQNLGQFAHNINQNIAQLGHLMQQGRAGDAGGGPGQGGYRTLKAKKEITAIGAEHAQALMLELSLGVTGLWSAQQGLRHP